MRKQRLDTLLTQKKLAPTRSQAEHLVKLGKVYINGAVATKPGQFVAENAALVVKTSEQYVSRAGLKLASVVAALHVSFAHKIVLDVGSSTGGFTDYALQHGAQKVIAVDVGTDQMHPTLRANPAIDLREKTDIRSIKQLATPPDIIVIDVSFISLREILPHIFAHLTKTTSQVVAMVKPQFEAGKHQVSKGVIKNDTIRRHILKDFEKWVKQYATITAKADSEITGAKGNRERFYVLLPLKK